MKYKKFEIKNKIKNHLTIEGKKETSEKILLKSFKALQKISKKQSEKLIRLNIILFIPIFKVYKSTNKNKKKKKIKEIPKIISTKKARISLAIKLILSTLKHKKSNSFYTKFYKEILLNLKNKEFSTQIKNQIQKQALIKKHFSFYKW